MTPEEKFDKDVWYVLKQIKERMLYTKIGDPISYRIYSNVIVAGCPTDEQEIVILEKLAEGFGAIRILKQYVTAEFDRVFHIELVRPEFEELYDRYQNKAGGDKKAPKVLEDTKTEQVLARISLNLRAAIKKVVETVLDEIELRNPPPVHDAILIRISRKKFDYPEDVARLIDKINEVGGHRVVRIFSEYEFDKSFLGSDRITEESVNKLRRQRSALALFDSVVKDPTEERLCFLIEDVEGLKAIRILLTSPEENGELLEKNGLDTNYIFRIRKKDREVWVNDFLLRSPHATGKNMAFLEYALSNSEELISRSDMPEYMQTEVKGKTFNKIFSELGFTGEILKAFVPKRSKSSFQFRKEVTVAILEEEGINVPALRLELALAHVKKIRNSPK